jgi:protein-S-isoprenylcysteine O-methyltransferase Ste14
MEGSIMSTTTHSQQHPLVDPWVSRIGWLFYGGASYAIGAGALFWFFFAISGLAPSGFGPMYTKNPLAAGIFNIVLLSLFIIQHSVMARVPFKQWLAKHIAPCAERASFVLLSGLTMGFLIWNWQALPGTAWMVDNIVGQTLLWIVNGVGILYILGASFATNHFELFGLRQVWIHFKGQEYQPVPFTQSWMYRYSRHPIMLGMFLVMWFTPDMSMTRLFIATLLSAYIFFGIHLEEKGLHEQFGDKYLEYKKSIGMFFTLKR